MATLPLSFIYTRQEIDPGPAPTCLTIVDFVNQLYPIARLEYVYILVC